MTLEELLSAKTDFSHLSGIMKEAAEKVAEEKKAKLLRLLIDTQKEVKDLIDNQVRELRRIRELERICLKHLEAMNTAFEYFEQTANPLPFYMAAGTTLRAHIFCKSVGVEIPAADNSMWKVK